MSGNEIKKHTKFLVYFFIYFDILLYVFKTESGVTDIESIPSFIKKLQNSILSDGC